MDRIKNNKLTKKLAGLFLALAVAFCFSAGPIGNEAVFGEETEQKSGGGDSAKKEPVELPERELYARSCAMIDGSS